MAMFGNFAKLRDQSLANPQPYQPMFSPQVAEASSIAPSGIAPGDQTGFTPPQIKGGGMFGGVDPSEPMSPGRTALAAFLGGLGGGPNPALQMMQQRQQLALEDRQYQRRQDAELARQKALYMFQVANPRPKEPTAFQQEMIAAGIDPSSPQGQDYLRQRVKNQVDPPHLIQDPVKGTLLVGGAYGYPGADTQIPTSATSILWNPRTT